MCFFLLFLRNLTLGFHDSENVAKFLIDTANSFISIFIFSYLFQLFSGWRGAEYWNSCGGSFNPGSKESFSGFKDPVNQLHNPHGTLSDSRK